jgi:arylsulfatase A-like enzyme
MRIQGIIVVVVFTLCLPALFGESADRPNVVLLMADDLGWGDLQCYRPESPIMTPHLNTMAKEGFQFTRFYSAAPVCSPTRGSSLTGRHPYRYGITYANKGHMKPEERTLAELLKKEGYATGHFGKWHLGTLTTKVRDANRGRPGNEKDYSPPWLHGFDVCFSTESKVPTWDPMIKPVNAPQTTWEPIDDQTGAMSYGTRFWNEQGEVVHENLEGDASRIIMDRALPFIEEAVSADTPFLAVIWFHTPHLPVVTGDAYADMYSEYALYERSYYGSITAMDDQIGRLRTLLKSLGVSEDTLVFFCSDNGPEGNSKAPGSAGELRGRKRSLYEGGLRVPGIVKWPKGIPEGFQSDFPTVTSDYLPTILDILNIEECALAPLDGISLLPILSRKQEIRRKPIGFESREQLAWITHDFKLYSGNGGDSWELYDLSTDPQERRNLASELPGKVELLAHEHRLWQLSCQRSAADGDY